MRLTLELIDYTLYKKITLLARKILALILFNIKKTLIISFFYLENIFKNSFNTFISIVNRAYNPNNFLSL